ncbi:MAG: isoprenylcysteine carboxylmethyltransferase family protein [Gammaproteobacteria bacterium]|nr:isoprenylcysteine carboxylmethyltransferase family protein [Gammaproteobacteria bacterium]MDH5651604.1 isoprenylcysteine carboxylmethyltransferase family protein [Gammaproteobacteria bacterium]
MQNRVLPIVIVLCFAALMFVLKLIVPAAPFAFELPMFIPLVVFCGGILVVLLGGIQFRQAGTTVNPLKPEQTSELVSTGLYSYSRNPMYVGFLLFLIAWGLYLGSGPGLLLLPLFVRLLTQVQIIPEEKMLEKKFGDRYTAYSKRVRRWI